MLYQWEVGRTTVPDILRTFWLHEAPDDGSSAVSPELRAFAERLATGVADAVTTIDPVIVESAEHWRLERMNVQTLGMLKKLVNAVKKSSGEGAP